jgi:hypothetical protein
MCRRPKAPLSAVSAFLVFTFACGRGTRTPAYHLEVRIEPEAGTLDCVVEIRNPADARFSLSRDMTIRRLVADGDSVSFRRVLVDSASSSTEITLASVPHDLVVEYGGRIEDTSYPAIVSQVNMIHAGLVELASYVGWFPRLQHGGPFDFRLEVDVPFRYVTLTNGVLKRETSWDDRRLTTWESTEPVNDIALVAAPGLRKSSVTRKGLTLEVYHAGLPDAYVDSMSQQLVASVDLLTAMLGPPSSADLVRVVYAPRAGWGYVRVPLIITSERYALAQRTQVFGSARDFKYLAHEIAHYWWHMADGSTPDDWINEGLAEYSALLVSERVVGKAFAGQLVREYRDRATHGLTDTPIAETTSDSPDRETNRYAKPVLLLLGLREQYGDIAVTRFLNAAYARFRKTGRATTRSFLEVLERQVGREARSAFEEALYRNGWPGAVAANDCCSPADSAFFGTWAGTLNQMGTESRVILGLSLAGGRLLPTGRQRDTVPVSGVRTTADSLMFWVGAYGIDYAGALDPGSMTIHGKWRQGGVAYPLDLSRADATPEPPPGRPRRQPRSHHSRAFWNNVSQGDTSYSRFHRSGIQPHSYGKAVRSGCGITARCRPSGEHIPAMARADPLGLNG